MFVKQRNEFKASMILNPSCHSPTNETKDMKEERRKQRNMHEDAVLILYNFIRLQSRNTLSLTENRLNVHMPAKRKYLVYPLFDLVLGSFSFLLFFVVVSLLNI